MLKYYFINKFDTNHINKQDKQTVIIYRNYNSKKIDQNLISKINKYCKKKLIKFYLSNNIELAMKLNLDGAYIPAFNNNLKHLAYSFKKDFKIVGSAHNFKEINVKKIRKCKEIFVSPIFNTPKNEYYLDIIKFNFLTMRTNKRIIALGGVRQKNLKRLSLTKSKGFGGISYFE